MLIICDIQSKFAGGSVIGAHYVIELPIYQAGVRHDPQEGYVVRPAETWLSAHQLQRLTGTYLVLIDPSDETNAAFPGNVVGTVLSARAEGDTCIATCRIIQQELADLLAEAEDLTIECELNILPGETNAETETDFDSVRAEPVPRLVNFVTMALVNGETND